MIIVKLIHGAWCLPVKWQNNYTQGLLVSVESDSSECGGNTDVPTSAFFWSRLPLFESLLYFPVAASSSLCRSELIGGHQSHGLTIGSAAWRILTVAKVLWMVSWPLDGLICCPSSLAWIFRDDMGCVDRVKSQDFFPFSQQWTKLSTLSLAVWSCLWLQAALVIASLTCIVSEFFVLSIIRIYCQEKFGKDSCCLQIGLLWKKEIKKWEKSSGSPSVQSSCRGKAMSTLQAQHIIEHRCQRSKEEACIVY